MKTEGRIFFFFAVFFAVVTPVYWYLSEDPIGTICLGLSAGLGLMIGYYLWITARRLDGLRPEDRLDAEVEDGAGEMGFFPPHSWWPLVLAAGAGLVVLGIIFGAWIGLPGAVLALWAISGYVMEYYNDRREPPIV